MDAHEIFSDANRKAWMQPVRYTPAQLALDLTIAEQGIDRSDDDPEDIQPWNAPNTPPTAR